MRRLFHHPATAVLLFALLLNCFFTFLACGRRDARSPNEKAIASLTEHWEKAFPYQEPPEGLSALSAQSCGRCHAEIYREWKRSFHAQAWHDLQFQIEWAKDDSLWVCLNCHTPLENQQEFIILGKRGRDYSQPVKKPNPRFNPMLREEAITCAVCHVWKKAVIGPFGNQDTAPHAVQKNALLSRKLCLSCHNVTDVLSPTLVCTFQTGEEWKQSSYPAQEKDCITCHMPPVNRPLVTGGDVRQGRKNTFVGSGIPKVSAPGNLQEGYVPGLEVEVIPSQKVFHPGDEAIFTIIAANKNAGHMIPTGDPEYFITLNFTLLEKDGRILKSVTHRIGQQWRWWPEAKKLADNRLKPEERRSFSFSFTIPDEAAGLTLRISATNHRMTEDNAKFLGLLGRYPLKALTYEKEFSIIVNR